MSSTLQAISVSMLMKKGRDKLDDYDYYDDYDDYDDHDDYDGPGISTTPSRVNQPPWVPTMESTLLSTQRRCLSRQTIKSFKI